MPKQMVQPQDVRKDRDRVIVEKKKTNTQSFAHQRAFTLMDLLVSIAIISVLIAILLPAISKVKESTRRVICGSNIRQLGLGVSEYANDHRERLPGSVFLPPPRSNTVSYPALHRMDTVWLTQEEFPEMRGDLWDGLGLLYRDEYVTAASIYYCPSHQGNFMFEDAADRWDNHNRDQEIIANYLYRGAGPDDSRVLFRIQPTAAIVTDTLRSYEDLNHEGGFNILQAGLAVSWHEDIGGQIAEDVLLRSGDDGGDQSSTVINAWGLLDGVDTPEDAPGDLP